jgi:hypothetical protein
VHFPGDTGSRKELRDLRAELLRIVERIDKALEA